jgi:3'-phosphoadenosine 5'-phosphosulfate (PAPS) 3'-phosphatase
MAAGGSVTQIDGSAFIYGKADAEFANPFFVARGR